MNFLKALHCRQSKNDSSCEGAFQDRSMELLFPTIGCHSKDEFRCMACHNDGFMHFDVPPFVSKFTTVQGQEHVVAVADEDGLITLMDSSDSSIITRFRAHSNAIFDLCWVDNEKRFVTVSGDQKAILWDVPASRPISIFEGHRRSIKTVHCRPGDTEVFATGSRDGDIMIWDTRSQKRGNCSKADNNLRNVHCLRNANVKSLKSIQKKQKHYDNVSLDALRSVTAVLFQDENTLLSTGVADGIIKVWDLRKNYSVYRNDPLPKYSLPYAGLSVKMNGYSNLAINSSGTRLFASCTDNVIYQFNCASYDPEPVAAYFGFVNDSFFVKAVLCPHEKYILSGSTDTNACIWQIDKPGYPIYRLSGHAAEVTSVDWCKDSYDTIKLVTCCDDSMFRIWRPHLIEQDRNDLICRCDPYKPATDLESDVRNPDYWKSKLKPFLKRTRVQHSALDSPGAVAQGSSIVVGASLKRLCSADQRTPKTVNALDDGSDRLARPKRQKLVHCTVMITPPTATVESLRKSENAKRTLTGKCLFSDDTELEALGDDDDDDDRMHPRKIHKTTTVRSPFKILTGNENSQQQNDLSQHSNTTDDEHVSFTCNLPNSVTDNLNDGSQKIRPKKRSRGEHWLSKLGKKRKEGRGREETKHPEQKRKRAARKSLRKIHPIKKYFSAIPVSGVNDNEERRSQMSTTTVVEKLEVTSVACSTPTS